MRQHVFVRKNGLTAPCRHVKSLVAQGAVAGDINNDGELEVGRAEPHTRYKGACPHTHHDSCRSAR